VTVTINGIERIIDPGTTVAGLVAATSHTAGGLAVALNESVVPRSRWPTTTVREGDRIEVLSAAQGG